MKPKLIFPYQSGLITVGGIAGVSLLLTGMTYFLSRGGWDKPFFYWISLTFLVFFGVAWLVTLLLGLNKRHKIRCFLESERPFIRWTYSETEWQRIKTGEWEESHGDWRVQWGCLGALLASVGLLTGFLLGLDEGLSGILRWGLVGLLVGGVAGFALGGLVAGGNALGGWLAYRRKIPGQVALGRGEVFVIDDYFKANGRSRAILSARLVPGRPHMLELVLRFPPRPRMPEGETWRIPVPGEWVARVEERLDQLTHLPNT